MFARRCAIILRGLTQRLGGTDDANGMRSRPLAPRRHACLRVRLRAALLGGTLCIATSDPHAAPAREIGLHFVDVGQGSALVVVGAEACVLVDSGPAGGAEAILAALAGRGIERVDLWVHTHFDADHLGGVTRVLAGLNGVLGDEDDLEVAEFWDRGLVDVPATATMDAYLAATAGRRHQVEAGVTWSTSDLEVRVIHGPASAAGENERGLALRIDVSGVTVLAPGDLPSATLEAVALAVGHVDVLWASHHGARSGISPALLDALGPAHVVVSAGIANPYCHPDAVSIAWLHDRRVTMTGAAGLGPDGPCEPLAPSLALGHVVVGGDLWIGATDA